MSFKLVAQVFDIRVGNPLRKMVLIKLADQANDDGYCWPSYETLAYSCEISRSSVINHIKWLAKNDFLWIEKRYDKDAQKNLSNIYHLTLSKGKQAKDVGGVAVTPVQEMNHDGVVQEIHHPSVGDTPEVVQEIHHPSVGDTPKPIIESISKPIIESNDWINESFEAFYESYPNKKGRGQAQKTWNNVFLGKGDHKKPSNPVELFETIMNAVKTQTPEILLSEPRFRKHPSTWLNAQAWLDEVILQPTQSPQATEKYVPAFNGWNDRNPDYKPSSQQPDVYHPSQAEFQPSESVTYVPAIGDPNWRWTEPLPGMSIIETDRYIKDHKRKGENPNRAYQRLLAEMQGETV